MIRRVARSYCTPLPLVADMEWLIVAEHYVAAIYDEYLDRRFQASVANKVLI